jgi:PRD1 phage membrane DNA delivery
MNTLLETLVGIFTGVVTVSIIAVIVSRRSQTPQVIQAGSTALARVVSAAVSPVSTAGTNANYNAYTFGGAIMPVTPSGFLPAGH